MQRGLLIHEWSIFRLIGEININFQIFVPDYNLIFD